MKNIPIILIIYLIFSGACYNKSNYNTVCNNVSISNQLDSLLQDFMAEHDTIDCQFYLVTYLSCDKKIVTLIANNLGDNYYLKKKSLFYLIKNEKKIYIITGIEDFFSNEFEEKSIKKDNSSSPFSNIKSYIIDNDTIELVPKGIPPFAPPPSKSEI